MANTESLITAYILDGKGGGRKIGWKEIKNWAPSQGLLWVHLNFTATHTKQWLKRESGLDEVVVQALLADESRPRAAFHADGLLVCMRGVNLNPGNDPEDMVSVRTWIEKNRIITTRRRVLLSVNDIREAIETSRGPRTSSEFIVMLSERLTNRMGDVINEVDGQVDELEQEVLTVKSHLLRPKIADIRRQAILIRRYLSPQREALYRLSMEKNKLISNSDLLYLRESTDRIIRYIEDLDSARERATITQEELTSRLSEQLDQRMYILSIVAAIFLPLTFVTGLLGINVGGIPGEKSDLGFTSVCIVLVVLTAGLLWFFKRKKWM